MASPMQYDFTVQRLVPTGTAVGMPRWRVPRTWADEWRGSETAVTHVYAPLPSRKHTQSPHRLRPHYESVRALVV